jgi:hypothetical protein
MNINKLWLLIDKLETEYFNLMNEVSSCFLQEMIDFESFNNEGPRQVARRVILDEIENSLGKAIMLHTQDATMEFCLTNEYRLEGTTWNCIEHLLQHHSDAMTANDKKYLKALNNSYLGVYKVVSVEPTISVTLRDMIEPNNKDLKLLDKNLSKVIKKDQTIATRLLTIEHKIKPSEYRLSNTLIFLPEIMASRAVNIIQMLTESMNQHSLVEAIVPEEERFEDTPHNRIMQKKMWAKEILEQWYLYQVNYEDYHEFFDYEGNPWKPSSLEFDITAPLKKISAIFDSLPNFIQNKTNAWSWIDITGYNDLINYTKKLRPTLRDSSKSPVYRGAIMRNELNKLSYPVLAEIKIQKNKLVVDVNSAQRANIALDFIIENCGNMMKIPAANHKIHPDTTWN